MTQLEEDIKHCEKVLAEWHGCDEGKAEHERLLEYMKELREYRKARDSIMTAMFYESPKQIEVKNNPFYIDFGGHGL